MATIKCFHCGKPLKGDGVLLNANGDFVCDDVCKTNYEKERQHFLDVVIHDDTKFADWLGVDHEYVKNS